MKYSIDLHSDRSRCRLSVCGKRCRTVASGCGDPIRPRSEQLVSVKYNKIHQLFHSFIHYILKKLITSIDE